MGDKLEIELERVKMKNYILEKENENLLGMIGIVTRDKEYLLKNKEKLEGEIQKLVKEMEEINNKKIYKLARKIDNILRRN